MSSVDSQVVDGVWGTPMPDPGPAAPEYTPSNAAPDNLPIGQEVAPNSVWDVAPSDEYVQVAQPQQDQTLPTQEPQQEPPQTAAPDPNDPLRQELAEMRRQLAQREQREQEGKRQWDEQVRQYQQNQLWQQRQQKMQAAIEQAQYLDTDAQKQYLTNAYNDIDSQYRNDYQQLQRTAQQQTEQALRQAMAPLYAQELLQTNGLPSEFMQHLNGVNPDAMDAVIPTLKAMYAMQQKIEQSNQQTQATNFNEWQRQHGVNRVASSNGSPAGIGSVKSGTPEHMAAIMRSME